MSDKRVVIIGAGVIGLCTALFCRRRGFDVTVIDRHRDSRDGCSFGNAGMVVPSHLVPLAAPGMVKLGLKWMWNSKSPFYIKPRLSWDLLAWGVQFWSSASRRHVEQAAPVLRDLHLLSKSLYQSLAAEAGAAFGFSQQGLLMLCKSPHGLEEEATAATCANRLGVPAEVLDRTGIEQLEPDMQTDVAGGVFYPQDAHLSPAALMTWLQATCTREGVRFCWEAQESGLLQIKDGRVTGARTASGPLVADEFVIAAGVWSAAIGKDVGLKLPMQAGKGYSLTLANPRQQPRTCAILSESRIAVTPMGNSLRFGGTMEIAGIDESITAERVAGIVEAIPRYYPAYDERDFAGVSAWRGLRPCSPDGMPYLGRSRRHANVIVATGHAMMGISLAPATGKIVADLIAGEAPAASLDMLNPDRFG